MSQARLCELTEIEPMNLVRIFDHMQSEGWVERRADPADRRARQLFLKPKALSMIDGEPMDRFTISHRHSKPQH